MNATEQHWLNLILVTWTVTSLAVLGAMLKSIIRLRRRARFSALFRVNTTVEGAWIVVPLTIVILMVVLAVRLHEIPAW